MVGQNEKPEVVESAAVPQKPSEETVINVTSSIYSFTIRTYQKECIICKSDQSPVQDFDTNYEQETVVLHTQQRHRQNKC